MTSLIRPAIVLFLIMTVLTGIDGPIVSTVGPKPSIATHSNALSESYGSLRTAGFIVNAADASNSV